MHVADHRADVSRGVWLLALALPLLDGGHIIDQRRVPLEAIGLVEGVDLPSRRDLQVGMSEHELSNLAVESEDVHAMAEREAEEDGGGVEAVAGGHEVLARLERVDQTLLARIHIVEVNLALFRIGLKDSEDRASGNTRIHIRRT